MVGLFITNHLEARGHFFDFVHITFKILGALFDQHYFLSIMILKVRSRSFFKIIANFQSLFEARLFKNKEIYTHSHYQKSSTSKPQGKDSFAKHFLSISGPFNFRREFFLNFSRPLPIFAQGTSKTPTFTQKSRSGNFLRSR